MYHITADGYRSVEVVNSALGSSSGQTRIYRVPMDKVPDLYILIQIGSPLHLLPAHARSATSCASFLDFLEPLFGRGCIALEPFLGLPLELLVGELDGDRHVQTLLDHLRLKSFLLAALDDAPLEGIIVDHFGERCLEAHLMHAAVAGALSVGVTIHGDLVASGWLQRDLYLHSILLFGDADDVL